MRYVENPFMSTYLQGRTCSMRVVVIGEQKDPLVAVLGTTAGEIHSE